MTAREKLLLRIDKLEGVLLAASYEGATASHYKGLMIGRYVIDFDAAGKDPVRAALNPGDTEWNAAEELLQRIGRAAVEVDRLRERKAAARRARSKIQCRRECNVSGGGRVFVDPCWKNHDVLDGVENECPNCRRRHIRQLAYAAESRRVAGARRRVTILARGYRRKHPANKL